MNFEASIAVYGNAENIMKLFMAEEKKFKHNRSSYKMEKIGNKVLFKINASDASALRSTMDSVAKGLKIYEDLNND